MRRDELYMLESQMIFDLLVHKHRLLLRIPYDGSSKVEAWEFKWIMLYATSKAAVSSAGPVY